MLLICGPSSLALSESLFEMHILWLQPRPTVVGILQEKNGPHPKFGSNVKSDNHRCAGTHTHTYTGRGNINVYYLHNEVSWGELSVSQAYLKIATKRQERKLTWSFYDGVATTIGIASRMCRLQLPPWGLSTLALAL